MRPEVLRYFTVLAEELHFGRAAARLAITQPPLSTAIKALEEELGVLLLQRNRQMVQLTPAGAAFLVEARSLLQGISRAKGVVQSIAKGNVGRLDVGFGGTMVFRDILKVVDQFKRDWPGIEIVLHEKTSSDQFDKLTRGLLDAGFAHGAAPPPQLKSIPMEEDWFVLCVPKGHPRAGDAVIDLRDLTDQAYVMFEREINPVNHDTLMGLFSREGIYPKFIHYTRQWMTSMSMVSEGCGMAIVPSSLARVKMEGVRLIPFAGPRVAAPAMLAWNPSLVSPALEKLIESASRTIQRIKGKTGSHPDSRSA